MSLKHLVITHFARKNGKLSQLFPILVLKTLTTAAISKYSAINSTAPLKSKSTILSSIRKANTQHINSWWTGGALIDFWFQQDTLKTARRVGYAVASTKPLCFSKESQLGCTRFKMCPSRKDSTSFTQRPRDFKNYTKSMAISKLSQKWFASPKKDLSKCGPTKTCQSPTPRTMCSAIKIKAIKYLYPTYWPLCKN